MRYRTTISAPGKVLVTGGYLVLDPAYTGTVLAASSRFYASVASIEAKAKDEASQPTDSGKIVVSSPQFIGAEWTYKVTFDDAVDVQQTSSASGGKNKFVELALRETLRLVCACKGIAAVAMLFRTGINVESLKIVIAGDNDFYSQRQAVSGGFELRHSVDC